MKPPWLVLILFIIIIIHGMHPPISINTSPASTSTRRLAQDRLFIGWNDLLNNEECCSVERLLLWTLPSMHSGHLRHGCRRTN